MGLGCALNPKTGVFIEKGEEDSGTQTYREEAHVSMEARDWAYAAIRQGMPKIADDIEAKRKLWNRLSSRTFKKG